MHDHQLACRNPKAGSAQVQSGRQFKCEGGEIFIAYDTGKVNCQGKVTELYKAVKSASLAKVRGAVPAKAVGLSVEKTPSKQVFIV